MYRPTVLLILAVSIFGFSSTTPAAVVGQSNVDMAVPSDASIAAGLGGNSQMVDSSSSNIPPEDMPFSDDLSSSTMAQQTVQSDPSSMGQQLYDYPVAPTAINSTGNTKKPCEKKQTPTNCGGAYGPCRPTPPPDGVIIPQVPLTVNITTPTVGIPPKHKCHKKPSPDGVIVPPTPTGIDYGNTTILPTPTGPTSLNTTTPTDGTYKVTLTQVYECPAPRTATVTMTSTCTVSATTTVTTTATTTTTVTGNCLQTGIPPPDGVSIPPTNSTITPPVAPQTSTGTPQVITSTPTDGSDYPEMPATPQVPTGGSNPYSPTPQTPTSTNNNSNY